MGGQDRVGGCGGEGREGEERERGKGWQKRGILAGVVGGVCTAATCCCCCYCCIYKFQKRAVARSSGFYPSTEGKWVEAVRYGVAADVND